MEVKVISREMIKPSLPTPSHLRHLQQSFYDQMQRRVLIPYLSFYPNGCEGDSSATNVERSHKLKTSLADLLTKFYPLAGRVHDGHTECNDEGVPYFEAQACCRLSQVVGESCLAKLNNLVPYRDWEDHDLPLAVQVNFFDCGRIAIGICCNHMVFDGVSIIYFINCWAAYARGDHCELINPIFDLPKLLPPKSLPSYNETSTYKYNNQKISAKRFVFTASSLSALKAKFANGLSSEAAPLSRIVVLSAFIWRRIVTQGNVSPTRRYLGFLMVNLRPWANPPLSESCFGNLVGFAKIGTSADPAMIDGSEFVTCTRNAVKRNVDSFVKKLENHASDGVQVDDYSTKPEDVNVKFSSFFNFPCYEADFGWGRPLRVTFAGSCFEDTVLYLPRESGDGVEVLLYLKEDDMTKLETDEEFLEFASLDTKSDTKIC
ncbi:Vinorine synthase [Bertholletia excelsa]